MRVCPGITSGPGLFSAAFTVAAQARPPLAAPEKAGRPLIRVTSNPVKSAKPYREPFQVRPFRIAHNVYYVKLRFEIRGGD